MVNLSYAFAFIINNKNLRLGGVSKLWVYAPLFCLHLRITWKDSEKTKYGLGQQLSMLELSNKVTAPLAFLRNTSK